MKFHCFDSSSLAKLFIEESGSAALRAYLSPANPSFLFASSLVSLEIYSALARRVRFGQISQTEFRNADSNLKASLERISLVAVDQRILRRSEGLIQTHGLRSLDAIHLATALLVSELCEPGDLLVFVCSDKELLFAAQKERLGVWDPVIAPPSSHPVN